MHPLIMGSLSWIEYQQRLQDEAIVFIPCGALEQHGPHLPLGTDALLSTSVAQSVAEKIDGIVAPTVSYGYKSQPKSGGGQHFPGTTSLDGNSLSQLIRDIVRELARQGGTKIAVVNGHYENQWFLTEGIDLAIRDVGSASTLRVMRLEYWEFLTPDILAKVFLEGFPGFALEHAAVIETSLMAHYHPNLVRLDLIPDVAAAEFPPYDLFPQCSDWVHVSGVLSSAKSASVEKGELMADHIAKGIATALKQEFPSLVSVPDMVLNQKA
ncbi:creatininase [Myxosarcina sp. GI1]|uniref:creatininase n=1 Tax=Myxosarcina sp. GI1 TaxID=1541065 RepID=UPI00055AD16C|nr:creatininase [Myxosarcina sp. GI1]